MKRVTSIAVWAATAALGLSAVESNSIAADLHSTTSAASRGRSLGHIERANKIIGKEVRDASNQKIGKLDDMVLDLTSGRVLYAVVDTSNKGKAALPPGLFTETGGDNMHISVDRQKLDSAPQFTSDIDKPGELSKADFISRVYQYYGQNEWWQGPNAPANQGSFNNVRKASELAGVDVKDVSNNKVGDVNSVAIDLAAGRVLYVIFSPDRDLKLGSDYYAIPPEAFSPNQDGKSLTSNLDRQRLASAPHFAKDNWSRLSDPAWAAQVYQHYGKQAYFETGSGLQPTGR